MRISAVSMLSVPNNYKYLAKREDISEHKKPAQKVNPNFSGKKNILGACVGGLIILSPLAMSLICTAPYYSVYKEEENDYKLARMKRNSKNIADIRTLVEIESIENDKKNLKIDNINFSVGDRFNKTDRKLSVSMKINGEKKSLDIGEFYAVPDVTSADGSYNYLLKAKLNGSDDTMEMFISKTKPNAYSVKLDGHNFEAVVQEDYIILTDKSGYKLFLKLKEYDGNGKYKPRDVFWAFAVLFSLLPICIMFDGNKKEHPITKLMNCV